MQLTNAKSDLRTLLVAACGLSALIALEHGAAAAEIAIAIRAQANPQGTVVQLGDVAEVTAESSAEAKRLAATPLMPTPAAGTERFLRMREIQDLLAAHGENMDQLQFKGELMVAIGTAESHDEPATGASKVDAGNARRSAWQTGAAKIEETAKTESAAANTNTRAVQAELNRRAAEYLNRVADQKSSLQVKVTIPSEQLALLPADASTWTLSGGTAPWTGTQRLWVSFPGPQGPDKFTMKAEVALPVAVAIRPIDRGDVVTAADVELQPRDFPPGAQGRSAPFTSIDKLIGMEATRAIQPGDVVMADNVQPPVLVKRGDSVTVYTRGGGIKVRTIAKARENGSLGQPVQIESLETHKTYDAVVTGMHEAVVFTGSPGPPAEAVSERGPALRR
jgi:flagella basal body P-ring formation protein FlgA